MRHDSSRQLYEYWNLLRGSRSAPERSEIEPSDIRDVLGDTFILEVSTQFRTIAFRLAGTRLCAAHGRELKGLGFLALWSEDDNFPIVKAVNKVYGKHEPMLISYAAQSETGRFVEYEAVLLPLQQAPDGNQRILGIATPKKTPYWLGAEALTLLHLRGARAIMPMTETAPMTTGAPAGPTAPGALQTGDQFPPSRKIGHLTVVDGGLS